MAHFSTFPQLEAERAKRNDDYFYLDVDVTNQDGEPVLSIGTPKDKITLFLDITQLQEIFGTINNYLEAESKAEREAEHYAEAMYDLSIEGSEDMFAKADMARGK